MNYTEIKCEQGSREWHLARFGRIGGSSVNKIVQTPKMQKTYSFILNAKPLKSAVHKEIYGFVTAAPRELSVIKKEFNCSDSPIATMVKNGYIECKETPLVGKDSLTDGSLTYLIEKITELKYGVPHGMYLHQGHDAYESFFRPIKQMAALEWGTEHEPEARAYFESLRQQPVIESGLLVHNQWPELSVSLDGQLNPNENIEIKCPYTRDNQTKLFITDKINPSYFDQMQLGMAVTGAELCHFISYDPTLPDGDPFKMYNKVIPRNEKRIETIMTAAVNFIKVIRQEIERFNLPHFYTETK